MVAKKKATPRASKKTTSPVKKVNRKVAVKGKKVAKTNAKKKSLKKKDDKGPSLAERLHLGIGTKPSLSGVSLKTNSIETFITPEAMRVEFAERRVELRAQYDDAQTEIKTVKDWIEAGLFGDEASCTIGLRQKFGNIVSPLRFVIQVHVPTKLDESTLRAIPKKLPKKKPLAANQKRYCVPPKVGSVITKVMETRPYRGVTMTASTTKLGTVRNSTTGELDDISTNLRLSLTETELIGGLPTEGEGTNNFGTIGVVVKESNGSHVALINAHFAKQNMVQPPRKPSSSQAPSLWKIGSPASLVENPISDGTKSYYVDAAKISLSGGRQLVEHLVQDFGSEPFLFAASPLGFFNAQTNRDDVAAKVFKFGAKTGRLMEGFIENPEDDSLKALGLVIRARRSIDAEFTDGGDSGSALVATVKDNEADGRIRFLVVGLCFGGIDGDNKRLFASHFSHVIKALDLEIPAELLRKNWSYD
jgi:hypothetical protein